LRNGCHVAGFSGILDLGAQIAQHQRAYRSNEVQSVLLASGALRQQ
jgi:hypothetical protein